MYRYDRVPFKAQKTAEGFIRDKPVIGRTGILRYLNADGSERLEYRPLEEAFSQDSLATLKGVPVTVGHHGLVTSDDIEHQQAIGTVLDAGEQDGNNIVADMVLYRLPTDARELSCGYTLDVDETPGTTPDGQHYDAIQRNIRYNHVAVVPRGRAGVARLNMDGDQVEDKGDNMKKIKLDTGLEYEVAPEVAVYVEKMQTELKDKKAAMDGLQAKYDAALDDNKQMRDKAEQAAKEAAEKFDAAVEERVAILQKARDFKIDGADKMTNDDIKKAVIKAVRGDDFDLEGKSADYIAAAYDLCKADQQKHDDGMESQRKDVNKPKEKEDGAEMSYAEAVEKYRRDMAELYLQGVE